LRIIEHLLIERTEHEKGIPPDRRGVPQKKTPTSAWKSEFAPWKHHRFFLQDEFMMVILKDRIKKCLYLSKTNTD
jgi:hypothetical protein